MVSHRTKSRANAPVAYVVYLHPYDSLAFVTTLVQLGLTVAERPYGEEHDRLAERLKPELVFLVLDPQEPGAVGVAREFVTKSGAPVLVLGQGPQTDGFTELLQAGVAQCLRETDPPELIGAQLEALIRRVRPRVQDERAILRIGALSVDRRRYEVRWDGANVALSPMEFRLLDQLAQNAGRVMSPRQLMRAMSEYAPSDSEARDAVKVYIRRIRLKLAEAGCRRPLLSTVRGFGYLLDGELEGHVEGTDREDLSRTADRRPGSLATELPFDVMTGVRHR